jgi:hypothetical protein
MTAAIVAVVTLYFCVPSPRLRDGVDGEVRSCVPANHCVTQLSIVQPAAARDRPEQIPGRKVRRGTRGKARCGD